MRDDLAHLLRALNVTMAADSMKPITYIVIIGVVFALVCLGGWIYLVFTAPAVSPSALGTDC